MYDSFLLGGMKLTLALAKTNTYQTDNKKIQKEEHEEILPAQDHPIFKSNYSWYSCRKFKTNQILNISAIHNIFHIHLKTTFS